MDTRPHRDPPRSLPSALSRLAGVLGEPGGRWLLVDVVLQKLLLVDRGKVIHSTSKNASGLESCLGLMATRSGRYAFKHGDPPCPHTIDHALDELWEMLG